MTHTLTALMVSVVVNTEETTVRPQVSMVSAHRTVEDGDPSVLQAPSMILGAHSVSQDPPIKKVVLSVVKNLLL